MRDVVAGRNRAESRDVSSGPGDTGTTIPKSEKETLPLPVRTRSLCGPLAFLIKRGKGVAALPYLPALMNSAIRSPIIMVVTLVLARMQSGMNGGIGHSQALQSVYLAVLAYHRHRIIGRSHLGSAGNMLGCRYFTEQVCVQGLVGGQLGVRWLDALLNDVVECGAFHPA